MPVYFIIFMIILSAAERAFVKKHRAAGKKENRNISLPGAVPGLLLFSLCTVLPCPALIPAQTTGVIPDGKDAVYKSFPAVPVNLITKPLTRLTAGEETDKALREENGIKE